MERGWSYSRGLVRLVEDYRRQHPWVFTALAAAVAPSAEEGSRLTLAAMLPNDEPGERREKVKRGAGEGCLCTQACGKARPAFCCRCLRRVARNHPQWRVFTALACQIDSNPTNHLPCRLHATLK